MKRLEWEEEFKFRGVIWTSGKNFKKDIRRFKAWSKREIDGINYLIPGFDDSDELIYITDKIIDYNTIVLWN